MKFVDPQKDLKHSIHLHPSYFGPSTQPYLVAKLYQDVEGTCTGKYGYIISVLTVKDTGSGAIQPGTGVRRSSALAFPEA
jgi:DNA-directed RNA polymerase II subunit RPB7